MNFSRFFWTPLACFILALALVIPRYSLQAQESTLRSSLFGEVDTIYADAKFARAEILSPSNFDTAVEAYIKAETRVSKGHKIEKIKKDLSRSIKYFKLALETAKLSEITFSNAILARNDAESSQASEYAEEEWLTAENQFRSAAETLELGNINKARKKAEKAELKYRQTELAAIKANYLDETRVLIMEAKKQKTQKFAPNLLSRAETDLNQAEKLLSQNRYDTDEARILAKQAKVNVKHAGVVTEKVVALKENKLRPEELIAYYEKMIMNIGNTVDLNTQFDQGYAIPVQQIIDKLNALDTAANELKERKSEIKLLQEEVVELEDKLGIQSQKIAKQEAAKRKFDALNRLFSDREAIIIMQSNNPTLRLIGLNFPSGSDQISSHNFSILKKVQRAIDSYPKATFVIEGHTDSFGGDKANFELSTRRAASIKDYLLANVKSPNSDQFKAVGFGETKPIASNETARGRQKNRRIDIRIVE